MTPRLPPLPPLWPLCYLCERCVTSLGDWSERYLHNFEFSFYRRAQRAAEVMILRDLSDLL